MSRKQTLSFMNTVAIASYAIFCRATQLSSYNTSSSILANVYILPSQGCLSNTVLLQKVLYRYFIESTQLIGELLNAEHTNLLIYKSCIL